jgi:hypothetical protein
MTASYSLRLQALVLLLGITLTLRSLARRRALDVLVRLVQKERCRVPPAGVCSDRGKIDCSGANGGTGFSKDSLGVADLSSNQGFDSLHLQVVYNE